MNNPSFSDRIFEGLETATSIHANYTRNSAHRGPEYIVTMSVACALRSGFDGHSEMSIQIHMERNVMQMMREGHMEKVGWVNSLKDKMKYVERTGRVDIAVSVDGIEEIFVVEIKRWDPTKNEVMKDLKRISEIAKSYKMRTTIKSCHLAYPIRNESHSIGQECIDKMSSDSDLKFTIERKKWNFHGWGDIESFTGWGDVITCCRRA